MWVTMKTLANYNPGTSPDPGLVVVVIIFAAIFLIVLVIGIAVKIRELMVPRKVGNRMRRFLGRRLLRTLRAHEKTFPGYDLPSLHRALESFYADHATGRITVGALLGRRSLAEVLQPNGKGEIAQYLPQPATFERMPVSLDAEESFASNQLELLTMRRSSPAPADGTEAEGVKIAVYLNLLKTSSVEYHEDADVRSAPISSIELSIACENADFADAFFKEIDQRRQQLSVYRGKVIEPVILGAGVQTITFRRIHHVQEADLILPESVKSIIRGAIVGFYDHRDALLSIGVEMKRGILFHSPPGTGKTSVCLWLAGMLPNFTVCFISGRRLMFPREVCAMARYLQPTMLVFEDIDLIAQERDHNGLATVLGELMNQIDGCEPNEQVLFVMNTNSMERLESAVRNRPGRVDQIIQIPLPDLDSRRRLIRHFGRSVRIGDDAVEQLAAAADGVTPAMLKEIVKRGAVSAVSRDGQAALPTAAGSNATAAQPAITVTAADLLLAMEQVLSLRSDARSIGARLQDSVL
jgi:hypothetical protein